VNNDFHQPRSIFETFEGLKVDSIDDEVQVPQKHQANGVLSETVSNTTNGDGDHVAVASTATA
jgi:hypothetical protein